MSVIRLDDDAAREAGPFCHAEHMDAPNTSDALRPTYWRVPFELAGDAAPRSFADPATVSWRTADDEADLVGLFARVLDDSIDPRDMDAVRRSGGRAVALRMIGDALSGGVYGCEREWWSIVAVDGEVAGVVLPVVFTGCARDGLDEATIYHLGVVAEQRRRGLGNLLLGRATDTLLAHGVWRISCDTAVENEVMIRLFERHGWTRGPETEVASR
jgi:ribosomal protein S18 acetylase RimI-like enzyme